jgi:hypothetical protein
MLGTLGAAGVDSEGALIGAADPGPPSNTEASQPTTSLGLHGRGSRLASWSHEAKREARFSTSEHPSTELECAAPSGVTDRRKSVTRHCTRTLTGRHAHPTTSQLGAGTAPSWALDVRYTSASRALLSTKPRHLAFEGKGSVRLVNRGTPGPWSYMAAPDGRPNAQRWTSSPSSRESRSPLVTIKKQEGTSAHTPCQLLTHQQRGGGGVPTPTPWSLTPGDSDPDSGPVAPAHVGTHTSDLNAWAA